MQKRLPDYQNFIHQRTYARWSYETGRRETWEETVDRYVDFWLGRYPELSRELENARRMIKSQGVMPSMRCLMTAGKALELDNVAGYNCAYTALDDPRKFSEILYILMCGTGVGYSVERRYVSKLPKVPESITDSGTLIGVADSKLGWADSYRQLIQLLYEGCAPKWDLSKLRMAGAILKTFGGRSSGPGPLDELFKFTVQIFKGARGRRLSSSEVHELVCKIASVVVVGGVRRSALISLSDLDDYDMRHIKDGPFWNEKPHLGYANNSACYASEPSLGQFLDEWKALYDNRQGERGIFSRHSCQKHVARSERRDSAHEFGTNPCSEIILRDSQFCNLSEVVVRPDDTVSTLQAKVRCATLLGTLQSTLTDFRFLSYKWKKNCQEERLLGVSLTGIYDNYLLSGGEGLDTLRESLEQLKKTAIESNKEYASKIGISPSTAITCVKPSGTVSQLCDTSSGIHPRFAEYYIRRVYVDRKDPLCTFLQDQGVPWEPRVGAEDDMAVFSFPMKAPEDSVTVDQVSAVDQAKLWLEYAKYWCEHKPSVTIYYDDSSFLELGQWVRDNWEYMSGISFLPYSDHGYQQAPYEAITEDTYRDLLGAMPSSIDWAKLSSYEAEDYTTSSQELACTANACEL